jgi:hypothetical protein
MDVNLFELWGKGIHVHYSTSSIAGVPLLTYKGYGTEKSFRGDDIRVSQSELGTLVSVTLDVVPDLKTDTFSFFVPVIHMSEGEQQTRFRSVGIHATHRTSIAGPQLVQGPLTTYDGTDLVGVGKSVVF